MRLCIAALFWAAAFLVQKFNWDAGGEKAIVLLALVLAIPFLLPAAMRPPRAEPPRLGRALGVLVAVLLVLQLAYFAKEMRHPHLIDVATTTLAAGKAMLAGKNPYLLQIDTVAAAHPETAAYAGYKYLPVMPMAYLPLGRWFGARGLLATNFLLDLATVLLLLRLGRRAASATAGRLAAALYLAVPLVTQQLLAKGATDLVAVVPLLGALLLVERNALLAGLLVGLSIAMKPVPGALLLPCLLPALLAARRRYAAGVVIGLLPILPFALWSPAALLDNAILFAAQRPPDSTSWLANMSPGVVPAVRAGFALLWLAVAVHVWRRPPPLAVRAGLGALLGLGAILSGPAAHHNYQLWWLPFYCLLLGRALLAQPFRGLPRDGDRVTSLRARGNGEYST